MRIGQLAKELNRTPNDLIGYLNDHASASEELHPNLKLSDEQVQLLVDKFGKTKSEGAIEEAVDIHEEDSIIEEKTQTPELIEEEKPTGNLPNEEETEIQFERGQEVNPKIIEQAELVEREKITLEGPKIIDKIEVPEEVEKRKQKKEEEAKQRAEERERRKAEREKKKFERYQQKMDRERKKQEREEQRKKKQQKRKAAEAKRNHYLEKVKTKPQPTTTKKKKKKQRLKEEVDPFMVGEIQKREQEARKKENKTLLGSIKRLFGL